MSDKNACQVCGATQWVALPDPVANKSVTTAGRIVEQPLGKSQCANCGFGQRVRASFLGFTDYYEQDYANYYERPGTEKFHLNRYKVMIEWMNQFIAKDSPIENVLDVGCGQGWAMTVFSQIHPKAKIEGVEPSEYNVKRAIAKGLKVMEGKLEDVPLKENHYDIIFSNNVIQHVTDAESFLTTLKKLIKKDGVIIVTCPNGAMPNIELLWADQNFSFLPQHLLAYAAKLGFKTSFWTSSPSNSSLPPAQLLVLTNNEHYKNLKTVGDPTIDINEVLKRRTDYLNSFSKLNQYLLEQTKASGSIYNLGASYWTSVLAAYCSSYWPSVKKIILDEDSSVDSFMGKQLIQSKNLNTTDKDTLVLGIAPASQINVKEKLQKDWKKVISWEHLLNY